LIFSLFFCLHLVDFAYNKTEYKKSFYSPSLISMLRLCQLPPNPLKVLPVHTRKMIYILILFFMSWSVLYYAALFAERSKSNVQITGADMWPGMMMTLAMVFIPAWDGSNRNSLASLTTPRRTGDICTVSGCKTVVGGGLFIGGFMWGMLNALHRYIIPLLPEQKMPNSSLPGWLIVLHLVLLFWTAWAVLDHSNTPANQTFSSDH
jgi:hypothetical protein